MIKCTENEKDIVVNILCKSFDEDQHINWLLSNSKNPRKIHIFMSYIFEEILNSGGDIYISESKDAVALWQRNMAHKFKIRSIYMAVVLGAKIGLRSAFKALRMERYSKNLRSGAKVFYRLILIGVLPDKRNKGLATSLISPVIEKVKEGSIPVYLETANKHNLEFYRKMGFIIEHGYENKDICIWYMKKS